MKYLIILISFFIMSCASVKFENSHPLNTEIISEFPNGMIGIFVNDELDTMIISKNMARNSNPEYNDSSDYIILNNTTNYLKKFDANRWIYNIKDNDLWEIAIIELSNNTLDIYYIDLDNNQDDILAQLENILKVKRFIDENGKLDYCIINPNDKQFNEIVKNNIFSKVISFKKID